MVRTPTYFLHLSFLLHGIGFLLLVAGCSTPYWTAVSTSSGDVHNLGLFVSCFNTGCQLLHLTETRDVMLLVFSLSTANIVTALFVYQLFCLSVFNNSCKSRNMGLALSYLSVLIALSVGLTQALYHIDLRGEDTPEVTSLKMGWSRYSVILSSPTFFLGAVLSVADYLKRNRVQQLHKGKKCEVRNKIMDMINKSVEVEAGKHVVDDTSGRTVAESACHDSRHGQRLSHAVDVAMKKVEAKSGLKKSMNECSNSKSKNNVILVNEATSCKRESGFQERGRRTLQSCDREGLAVVADAFRKYNSVKSEITVCAEGKHCLPDIEEETGHVDMTRSRQSSKPTLTRQGALVDDSDNSCDSSKKNYVADTNDNGLDSERMSHGPTAVHSPHKKHVTLTDTRDQMSKCIDERGEYSKNTTGTLSQSQKSRRNSAVEDALLSVSELLETTVSGRSFSAEHGSGRNSQPIHNRTSDLVSDRPMVGKWRDIVHGQTRRNSDSSVAGQVTCMSLKSRNTVSTHHQNQIKLAHDNFCRGYETPRGSNMKMAIGADGTCPKWGKFQRKMSDDEIKRCMIVECLNRDLRGRRKGIAQ